MKSKRKKNSLNLIPIKDDFVLPHKSVLIGECQKKNRHLGSETRYLLLGTSQLLIARDPKFVNIVNVIPLEGGNAIINKYKDNTSTLIVYTHDRKFELKFGSEHEADEWRRAMNLVLSKQIKIDKYKKRKKV